MVVEVRLRLALDRLACRPTGLAHQAAAALGVGLCGCRVPGETGTQSGDGAAVDVGDGVRDADFRLLHVNHDVWPPQA